MEDVFAREEHAKNIYVIKHKLSDLKRVPGQLFFEWRIGPFYVRIFTQLWEEKDLGITSTLHLLPADRRNIEYLTQAELVDVEVWESARHADGKSWDVVIPLANDPRFKNYKPIQYNVIESPNSSINLSSGRSMPITHLCELIRYLHRLANLTAFM
jgi:hypothetical protein